MAWFDDEVARLERQTAVLDDMRLELRRVVTDSDDRHLLRLASSASTPASAPGAGLVSPAAYHEAVEAARSLRVMLARAEHAAAAAEAADPVLGGMAAPAVAEASRQLAALRRAILERWRELSFCDDATVAGALALVTSSAIVHGESGSIASAVRDALTAEASAALDASTASSALAESGSPPIDAATVGGHEALYARAGSFA